MGEPYHHLIKAQNLLCGRVVLCPMPEYLEKTIYMDSVISTIFQLYRDGNKFVPPVGPNLQSPAHLTVPQPLCYGTINLCLYNNKSSIFPMSNRQ